MSNYKIDQRGHAKYLYFTTELTQRAIAKITNVSEQSMCAWVKKGNWANLKRAAYHSPDQEVQQLYEELRVINKNIKYQKRLQSPIA